MKNEHKNIVIKPTFGSIGLGIPVPQELIESKIVNIGAPLNDKSFEGGGLIIDYIPEHESRIKRIGLSFTELGMWIVFNDYLR